MSGLPDISRVRKALRWCDKNGFALQCGHTGMIVEPIPPEYQCLMTTIKPDQNPCGSVVYFVVAPLVRRVKIGYSTNIYRRFHTQKKPSACDLVLAAYRPGTIIDEAMLHQEHKKDRVRGEWFNLTAELREEIHAALEELRK